LSPAEHDAVDAVHTDAAAVHMVLQLGYFKAKRQFENDTGFGSLTEAVDTTLMTFKLPFFRV
jgi:hypothetical protein